MLLWTMQPLSALNDLKEKGVFRCDRRQSFNLTKENSLESPYQWMIRKMEEKIGPRPEGVTYPVWAWHTWEFEHKMPDPNSGAFVKRSEKKVFFTLDIPEGHYVLSDFDAWQIVMMGAYLTDATSELEYDRQMCKVETMPEKELKIASEKSWNNVFLVDPVNNNVCVRGKYVQATFWEIRPEYILDTIILDPTI